MITKNASAPHESSTLAVTRRNFLSGPLILSGLVLLNDKAVNASINPGAAAVAAARIIDEYVSVADSVTLYANLLPDVRRWALDDKLNRQDLSGILRRTKLDNTEINRRIDAVHSYLLKASESFDAAKGAEPDEGAKFRADGKAQLDRAIETLNKCSRSKLNEASLNLSIVRLIVLLHGVEFVVDLDTAATKNFKSHSSYRPALLKSGIKDVLYANVKPGSLIQIGIGYAVAFPILLRNKDKDIREKLLLDGLRLVPGLVPSPLINTAQQLAALSL